MSGKTPLSLQTVDLVGHRNDVILKESQRLKNLPSILGAPNNVRSAATSLEDPSHSLDAPPQDDIPASIKSTVPLPRG
jgi:hypothetical protein